jgi:hypothetical protein
MAGSYLFDLIIRKFHEVAVTKRIFATEITWNEEDNNSNTVCMDYAVGGCIGVDHHHLGSV